MPWRAGRRAALVVIATITSLVAGAAAASADPGMSARDARTGLDVSWPQCGDILPTGVPFAVLGVNGGTAANTNPCLAEQLRWAFDHTTGTDGQDRVQLYVNTANPGEVVEEYQVSTWPTDNVDGRGADTFDHADEARRNPYGRCLPTPGSYRGYTNDLACSWQYGWNRAVEAVDDRFAPAARAAGVSAAAADYRWWLDVETMNSWQQDGPQADARNAATLEGMAQLYAAEGAEVGLYSTHYQWGRIVGGAVGSPDAAGHPIGGNLRGAPSWLAGAVTPTAAEVRCTSLSGLTGGPVVMNQYIADDLDHNVSCTS